MSTVDTTFRQLQIFLKGGDFMGRIEMDHPTSFAASQMIWEGGPVTPITEASPVNPAQGRVLNERSSSTHPLRTRVVISRNGIHQEGLSALDRKIMSAMEGRD